MRCRACGAIAGSAARFCDQCGSRLPASSRGTTPAETDAGPPSRARARRGRAAAPAQSSSSISSPSCSAGARSGRIAAAGRSAAADSRLSRTSPPRQAVIRSSSAHCRGSRSVYEIDIGTTIGVVVKDRDAACRRFKDVVFSRFSRAVTETCEGRFVSYVFKNNGRARIRDANRATRSVGGGRSG